MYFAEENDRLRRIVQRIAEGSPGKVTSRPIDALLYSVVRATEPERCLELGAYEGTTSLYIAQGLEDNGTGSLKAIEIDEGRASAAEDHLEDAGLSDRVEVSVGDSRELVPAMDESFDLIFIDTTPNQYDEDVENAMAHLAEGGILGVYEVLGETEVVERMREDLDVIEFEKYGSFVLAQKSL
jgi:predicted O-methyltransferase YrrM